MNIVTITPADNGPYLVHGNITLLDADGNPYQAGDMIALCRCGQSNNKPFCDGTHEKTNFAAVDRHAAHPAPHERDASAHTTPPVPLHVVAGRLGDDPKTVLATYAHLLPHSDAMAANAVAAAIFADKSLTNRAIPKLVPAN